MRALAFVLATLATPAMTGGAVTETYEASGLLNYEIAAGAFLPG